MLRTPLSRLTIAAGAALALAACQPDQTPTAVTPPRPVANLASSQGNGPPSADELDRQVPGFGGFFLDRDGSPSIYLTRGSDRAPAERALGQYLAGRGLSNASLRVLEGKYNWKQLQRWQDQATDAAFGVDGTVFVDNDESNNRVLIGVANLNSAGQVRAALARSGIDDDAVIVQQVDPIVQVSTLQNIVDRPVRAGVQINFPGFLCSIGFNATLNGQRAFITASHCTNTQGGVESTPYWQPLQTTAPAQIATEVADPQYTHLAGCPRRNVCRYSDASGAAYASTTASSLGHIAMPTGGAPNTGSITVSTTGDFTITSDDDSCGAMGGCLSVGTTVNKVGRTTGWTSGKITNTCVNTGVQGSRIVQLCQTFVSAGVGGGDSGSGVFVVTSGTSAQLAGILWGGNNSGTQFVFSALNNVRAELGSVITH